MKIFRPLLAAICAIALIAPSFTVSGADNAVVSAQIKSTAPILMQKVAEPQLGSVGGEWVMIGLARSGETVPDSYIKGYYNNILSELKKNGGSITTVKYTEYSRLILSLTALGYNVRNVGGYNLLEKLSDFDMIIKQGVNGPIFALLALDSHSYEIPVTGAANQTTRQKLVDYILARECSDGGVKGGFALGDGGPQIDVTAMAIQALSKYTFQDKVAAAVDRGTKTLTRLESGAALSTLWNENSAESASQAIVAMAALNIDAGKDIEALMKYAIKSGGFSHEEGGAFDQMSTEQAFTALVAYDRYLTGRQPLYDMSDVAVAGAPAGNANEISVILNGKKLNFDQPPVNAGGRVLVPLRAIFEALGAEVSWDVRTNTVTGTTEAHTVILKVGDNGATLDGKRVTFDTPSQIIGGRTMVPVRFIAESLDTKVDWYAKINTVYINK